MTFWLERKMLSVWMGGKNSMALNERQSAHLQVQGFPMIPDWGHWVGHLTTLQTSILTFRGNKNKILSLPRFPISLSFLIIIILISITISHISLSPSSYYYHFTLFVMIFLSCPSPSFRFLSIHTYRKDEYDYHQLITKDEREGREEVESEITKSFFRRQYIKTEISRHLIHFTSVPTSNSTNSSFHPVTTTRIVHQYLNHHEDIVYRLFCSFLHLTRGVIYSRNRSIGRIIECHRREQGTKEKGVKETHLLLLDRRKQENLRRTIPSSTPNSVSTKTF